jgi:eukaryotic-like serine/threonine-protein kinase
LTSQESVEISKSCVTCQGTFSAELSVCPNDGTPLTAVVEDRKPGSIIAEKYEIIEVVGTGGMGKVYKAKHILMNRIVAIKTLLPQSVSNSVALKRFQQEAQAASALNHPNILTVYDFGITPDGLPYLVMDFLEGTTLGDAVLDVGPLPIRRALPIFLQVCDGLAHAHENGVIHRDLKPTNIMLIDYGGTPDFVKIVDFGIAKVVSKTDADESSSPQLTQTGEVFGSPLYMSPEQCRGKVLDARSDIYSLGCVMFRTLTGKPPFTGEDRLEAMFKQINSDAPRLSEFCPELSVSNELEQVVLKCLAKSPADRYGSMVELAAALEGLPDYQATAGRVTTRASHFRLSAMPAPSEQKPESKTDKSGIVNSGTQPSLPPSKSIEKTDPNLPAITIHMPLKVSALFVKTKALAKVYIEKLKQSRMVQASSAVALLAVPAGAIYLFSPHPSAKDSGQPALTLPGFTRKPTDMVRDAEKLLDQGKFAKAEQLAGEALKLATERKDLEGSIAATSALASICLREYKYKEAWSYADWIIDVKKHGQPVDDYQYSRALNIMGIIATLEKKYPTARQLLDQAQEIREKFKGSYRTHYARTLAAQGNLARAEGKYAKSIALLQEARSIAEPISGMGDVETQTIVNDLGQSYQFAGKLGNAEECYTTALNERERTLDRDNPAIAESQVCLAFLRAKQGRTEEAVQLFERALTIYEKAFGKSSPTAAELCYAFGSVLEQQKKYSLAETYFKEAYQMRLASLSPTDPVLIDTQKKYDAVLRKLNKR